MKAADITLGNEYAVTDAGMTRRAKVTEIRIPTMDEHRVYSGARWDFRGHAAQVKMARVLYVHRNGGTEESDWVALTQVDCPWDEHAAREAARADRAAGIDHSLSDIERRVKELTGETIYFNRHTSPGDPVGYTRVSSNFIRTLLEKAGA